MTISRDLLRLKLAESLKRPRTRLTRRDVHVPQVPNKALAVIGVRRGGKTSFLQHHRTERIAAGESPDAHLFISLEDERLEGMTVADLGWILEEHARQFPALHASSSVTLYLDEVQVVPGWEGLVRRLMDSGAAKVLVSGSSARLVSREVATSLRGRAMEALVLPFNFREALRHAGKEPAKPVGRMDANERARLDQQLRQYLAEGGFPEAQGITHRDRMSLLAGYVDTMLIRDIIERHVVTNARALRWLVNQLFANPGSMFSVKKHYDTLRSQGMAVGKDTLHDYLAHLVDAFMVTTVALHTPSERKRMVNPRKAYPVDTGLITLYERNGRTNKGRALETAVLLELERRGYDVTYWLAKEGHEVDFVAHRAGTPTLLIQVCLEAEAPETWAREVRALEEAARHFAAARALLITLDTTPPRAAMPKKISWVPASRWLLGEIEP